VCCRGRTPDSSVLDSAIGQVILAEGSSRDNQVQYEALCNMMPQAMVEHLVLLIEGCRQLAVEEVEVSEHKQARLKEFKVPDKYARVPVVAYLMTASKLLECCAKDTYVRACVFAVLVVDMVVCVQEHVEMCVLFKRFADMVDAKKTNGRRWKDEDVGEAMAKLAPRTVMTTPPDSPPTVPAPRARPSAFAIGVPTLKRTRSTMDEE
jgi:hypothetical protein